jgi:hypothetical protein
MISQKYYTIYFSVRQNYSASYALWNNKRYKVPAVESTAR